MIREKRGDDISTERGKFRLPEIGKVRCVKAVYRFCVLYLLMSNQKLVDAQRMETYGFECAGITIKSLIFEEIVRIECLHH